MSAPTEGDFDLASLNDEELTEQIHDDLYNGLKTEVEEATRIFLKRGWSAERVLNDALVEGMRIVGIDFRDGILFVPEVLLAANSMKGGMEILRPLLAETGVEPIGKIVIGTVKGDIHDIGKNLVSMMLEGAGFEVIDLGINNPVEKYLEALDKHKPDILGMSALLTTTMPYMKVVIDTLKERGIRNDYIVLVGGALAHEITALRRANGWDELDVSCLPAELHNRPEKIPGAVRTLIRASRDRYRSIFVAYGDCGTGGLLDDVLREEGIERIPGAHCYEFFATGPVFAALADAEAGTFYLTDFLLRHFERLVIRGLGLDRHPELFPAYFGNYRKLVYLAQSPLPEAESLAGAIAVRMGLAFEYRATGYGSLETSIRGAVAHANAQRSEVAL